MSKVYLCAVGYVTTVAMLFFTWQSSASAFKEPSFKEKERERERERETFVFISYVLQ
jgi:hypothetical protein